MRPVRAAVRADRIHVSPIPATTAGMLYILELYMLSYV